MLTDDCRELNVTHFPDVSFKLNSTNAHELIVNDLSSSGELVRVVADYFPLFFSFLGVVALLMKSFQCLAMLSLRWSIISAIESIMNKTSNPYSASPY